MPSWREKETSVLSVPRWLLQNLLLDTLPFNWNTISFIAEAVAKCKF